MTAQAIRLLAAIRSADHQRVQQIESLPEWRQPRLDGPYQHEREQAAGWIRYTPSEWLGISVGGERNRLRLALAELVDAGWVTVLVTGRRTTHVRLQHRR